MYDTGVICHECYGECVGAVFCGNGGQQNPDVRLPKTLNITIEANPDFWGFGGVLFSGDVVYSSSKFDYWNNFQENWLKDKECIDTTVFDLVNEERPDIKYRSVYDPDTGTITYSGNVEVDELGGPSVYLIDRDATYINDVDSCDNRNPNTVFRHHPENFGFGNKILFEENIFKNLSAAWRGADTGIPNFTFNDSGLPDGAVVGPYTGSVTGVYRDTATDPFIHLRVQYAGSAAPAIRNGQVVYLHSTCADQTYESQYLPDGAYYVTKVADYGDYTDCSLVGSVGTEDFSELLTNSTWTVAGSLDEQTCRSKRAYGVDYEHKCASLDYNYHADLGVVINDSRNRIHSNRTTRDKFGWTNTRSADDKPRRDYTYVSIQESGHGFLVRDVDTDKPALVCETGIWNPTWDFIYTSGDNYYSASKPEDFLNVSGYHSDAPNTLVNIGYSLIGTCGCPSGEPLGLYDISTGCLPVGWGKYAVSSGMYPMYGRELPFYGPFYEVYDKDNAIRHWQQDNTIKARNHTCYTPLATLEVYPDCITQQVDYTQCGGGTAYLINNVPRLAFIYRCFDYQEPCSYFESGLPYSGDPTNIDDLRRGLAGQEVYMYINLGDAWAGEIKRDPCACSDPPPGNVTPEMMYITSPVTYASFPKFDLRPNEYGAQDQLWKRYAANILESEPLGSLSCPVALTGDYGFVTQPYTTYGFIRNLCGKETVLSKSVIQSLNEVNTGAYRNTTPEDNTVEPMYWEFENEAVNWATGLTNPVKGSGTLATWGVVDDNDRLVAPYYPTVSGVAYNLCTPATVEAEYNKFNMQAALTGNWPTDKVPFLITIDHDNNCAAGCGTINMPQDVTFNMSITSLDRSYTHNVNNKYGYTHCGSGLSSEVLSWSYDPVFNCESGFPTNACTIPELSTASVTVVDSGSSCDCLSAFSFNLTGVPLVGADINKYWISVNPNSDNKLNHFVPIEGCVFDGPKYWFESPSLGLATANINYGITKKIPYLLAKFGCQRGATTFNDPNSLINLYLDSYPEGLSTFYGPGGCTHSYPGVNNRPELFTDWWVVMENYTWLFDEIPTEQVYLIESQLTNGVDPPSLDSCTTQSLPSGHAIFNFGLAGCSGSTLTVYGCRLVDNIIYDGVCSTGTPPVDLSDTGCYITDDCGTVTYNTGSREVASLPSTAICGCKCLDTGDALVMFTCEWVDGSGWYTSTGYPFQDYIGVDCADDWSYPPEFEVMKFFSATKLPSLGTTPIMPFNDPIAGRVGYSSPQSACSWKDDIDPNAFTYVNYKINPPGKHSEVRNDSPCDELWPNYCDVQWAACSANGDVYRSTCLTPIYGGTSVRVRRKRAYPEIMTVHKIDCLGGGSGYNLHVSREYHTHDRSWSYPIDGYTCDTYFGAIDGGGYNWRLVDTTPDTEVCPQFFYHPCSSDFAAAWPAVDTGNPYSLEGPFPSYYLLPHATPSDQVTPAWPTENNSALSTSRSLCVTHPHSGSLPNYSVTRDFQNTIEPYNAAYIEWVRLENSGGIVQAPLYTGVLETPDTGVYGDYCDGTVSTGSLVDIWVPRGRTFLPVSITNNLSLAGFNTNSIQQGYNACSGISWAISGDPLYTYNNNGTYRYFTQDETSEAQCDIRQKYPELSGVVLWNYYNLFYGSGSPEARFYNAVNIITPDPEGGCGDEGSQPPPWNFGSPYAPYNIADDHFGPLYDSTTGVPLNRKHSCIQDSIQCGGEIWNNKMFFPRKPYEAGTRVTAFGALSLCTQNTQYETSSWLEGYEDLSDITTPDLLREAINTRFIDACDYEAHSVTLQSDVDIDDVIIHVDDYLPLLGMYFVDRKMKLGDYTCLQPNSGCYDFLPIHSDQTLNVINFAPANTWDDNQDESLGYHLDKLVTTAQDQCLFKPFKIMVDVDCCPDVIRKYGQETGVYDPTYLTWVDTNVPAAICNYYNEPPSCGCINTSCNEFYKNERWKPNACLNALVLNYGSSSGACSGNYLYIDSEGENDAAICAGSGTSETVWSFTPIPDCILIDTENNDPMSALSSASYFKYGGKTATCEIVGSTCVMYDASGNCTMWTPSSEFVDYCYVANDDLVNGYTYQGTPVQFTQTTIPAFKCGDNYLVFDTDAQGANCCSLKQTTNGKCDLDTGYVLPTGTACYAHDLSSLNTVSSQLGSGWWIDCCSGPQFLYDTTIMDVTICDDPSNIMFIMTENTL